MNLAEWSSHLLERLHHQCEATANPELIKQYHELKSYPMQARSGPLSSDNVAISFKLRMKGDVLSFISTTMISAPRSTSRRRNWRWKRSSPPTI